MHFRERPQFFGAGLGGYVALGIAGHFIAHHKLLDGGRAEQGRIEVYMKVPFGMSRSIRWFLMEDGRIGKRGVEHIIVAGGQTFQNVGQRLFFGSGHLKETGDPATAQNHCLKRPDCPEWNEGDEVSVVADNPLTPFQLQPQVRCWGSSGS